jgi:two-component system, NtrC family, sensor histidine kinase HydH
VALVITRYSGYRRAQNYAAILANSEITGMLNSLRRELRQYRGTAPHEAISEFVADAEDQGLRYIAFHDRSFGVVQSFGVLSVPFDTELFRTVAAHHFRRGWRSGPTPPALRWYKDGIVHAVLPIPGPRWGARFFGTDVMPVFVAIEAKSLEGPRIVSQALVALAIALGAGLLLIGAAVLFWRQSIKQERDARRVAEERLAMVEELEKDKRLKALGRMSAVLGHQLKNPIAALKGHAQLLVQKISSEHRGRKQAETVLNEALLLETLTTQILEYARTGELNISRVYVDDLVYSAVELSGLKGVEIDVPEEMAWYLDRARMEQVLVNLLTNAAEASDGDSVVKIGADMNGSVLEIAVRDQGKGFDPGEEERLFEPFYTNKIHGTGLGLALVKRIVESHDGAISARNGTKGGAVFTIRLPQRAQA